MERYDVIVIGGGPGGYVAAIRAAQLGKKVALIEKERVGGTCLNRGCIPTKALMHSAEVLREIKNAEELGISVSEVKCDFSKMHERKTEVVDKLVTGVEALIKANGIEYYQGIGKVIDKNQVHIDLAVKEGFEEESHYAESENGQLTISGDYIILATGSRPALPPIPGLDLAGVVTSDDILIGSGLKTDSLIIIGGGVIGTEIASVYNSLGTEVTIIEAMDRILPTLDKEISQNLNMILKKRGIVINTGAKVESVEKVGGELSVNFESKGEKKTASAKNVLVAIGRRPNTEEILAEELLADVTKSIVEEGLAKEDALNSSKDHVAVCKNFVLTDENGKTGVDSIYAIGDIVFGGIQLAHAASAEAINSVDSIFEEDGAKSSGSHGLAKALGFIPSGIYTDPEVASVGITEAEAKTKEISIRIGKALTGSNGKTLIESGDRGYVKLIFSEEATPEYERGQLIGAQIVSKRATDMIGGLATAMSARVTIDTLSTVIWPHPTFSEVVGEAIEDAMDGAIHAMPKRKK